MAYDFFQTMMVIVGVALVIALIYLKYINHGKDGHSNPPAMNADAGGSGGWDHHVERRVLKRSAGVIFRRPDGSWASR